MLPGIPIRLWDAYQAEEFDSVLGRPERAPSSCRPTANIQQQQGQHTDPWRGSKRSSQLGDAASSQYLPRRSLRHQTDGPQSTSDPSCSRAQDRIQKTFRTYNSRICMLKASPEFGYLITVMTPRKLAAMLLLQASKAGHTNVYRGDQGGGKNYRDAGQLSALQSEVCL